MDNRRLQPSTRWGTGWRAFWRKRLSICSRVSALHASAERATSEREYTWCSHLRSGGGVHDGAHAGRAGDAGEGCAARHPDAAGDEARISRRLRGRARRIRDAGDGGNRQAARHSVLVRWKGEGPSEVLDSQKCTLTRELQVAGRTGAYSEVSRGARRRQTPPAFARIFSFLFFRLFRVSASPPRFFAKVYLCAPFATGAGNLNQRLSSQQKRLRYLNVATGKQSQRSVMNDRGDAGDLLRKYFRTIFRAVEGL